MTGQYVLRLSLAETGLNATYFNTTSFGYLVDKNFNPTNFSLTREGIANNLGTKIGWTGDLGGLPNPRGSRGIDGSYHHKYTSKVEENIDIDLVNGNVNLFVNDGSQLEDGVTKFKFRDEFWSARFTGMITPEYAEMYKFYLELGNTSESTAQLRIGGRGNEFNMSEPGDIVIDVQLTGIATSFGFYNFTDNLYREFVLEYTLKRGDAVLQLYWESPSTPYSIVPSSAFTYWRNISFYNTTIAPNELCSRCSTTFGEALQSAQVGVAKSFLVYGRDRFGNLLQVGGDQVTMVAIGKDGVAFRGIVTDYGNSTYLVEYYPTQAGVFRMYVSIGCCAPTSSVGYPAEIVKLSPLLVADSPFTLTIVPASIDALRSVAVGNGLVGGIAGELSSFAILYRDLHNNPTTNEYTKDVTVLLTMFDMSSESVTVTTTININYYLNNATITYNLTQAGSYRLSVQLKLDSNDPVDIVGSPYYTRVSPAAADPRMTICRGIGLRQASTNKTANFEIQLFDSFRNNLEVGGDQLYVRLLGDAALEQPSIPVVPRCVDTRNGRYRCEYQPTYKGTHEIIVKLLPSFTHPGGNGLRGNYYNSASVGLANGENTLNPTLVYTAVDPVLSFDFPDGFIVPSQQIVNRSTGNVPLSAAGQSVRWEGYLVAPRDETYTISTRNVNNIQLTVYIDAVMVYDNSMNYEIINPIILVQSQVYYIRIEAVRPSVINSAELMPISFEVIWSAYTIKPHVIPTYFLYDSAEEVRLSPFPVTVY